MALSINGRMKVKTLKTDFKKEFGLNIRLYDGREFADDDATLASIRKGDNTGGEFSPARNTKVGNLEDKILELFGLKTQVAGSDDSYLCENDHTLAKALEVDEKLMIKRANRENKIVDNVEDSEEASTNEFQVGEEKGVYIRGDADTDIDDNNFLRIAVNFTVTTDEDGNQIYVACVIENMGRAEYNDTYIYVDTKNKFFAEASGPDSWGCIYDLNNPDEVVEEDYEPEPEIATKLYDQMYDLQMYLREDGDDFTWYIDEDYAEEMEIIEGKYGNTCKVYKKGNIQVLEAISKYVAIAWQCK